MSIKWSLVLAFCLCGCSAVYSTRPIGDRPADLGRDKAEWEGTWVYSDGAVSVLVADGTNGILRIAWIDKDNDEFKLKSQDVYLRTFGDWTFASLKDVDHADENRYVWARIRKKDSHILLWAPNVPAFRAMIENGRLPGTTNGSDLIVGNLSSNHLALITSETNGFLFGWDDPLVFSRTSK